MAAVLQKPRTDGFEVLASYHFTIQHRPGRQHNNADGLSRRLCEPYNYCSRHEGKDNQATNKDEIEHLRINKITKEPEIMDTEEQDTEEGRLLKRLREKARRKGCEVTNVPDGYSGIIKTERCELPDGTVYSLTSHWVPHIPIRKQQHFSAQWGTRSELDFSAHCNITRKTEEVGSQTEDVRIVTRTIGSEYDIISCRMY